MTGEVTDGSRNRRHQRSQSTIGDSAVASPAPVIEPKDLALQKAPSTKEKVAGKDQGRGWFKSKKAQVKEPQTVDEVPEEDQSLAKPVQRVVQGLYRDDDFGPSPKILVTSHSAARDAIKEFTKEFLAQLKLQPEGSAAMEAQMRRQFALDADFPRSDLKYLVQAYIAHRFFVDFENASFGISHPGERPWEVHQHMVDCFEQFQTFKTRSQTVSKLLENEMNETFLSKFCFKKYKTLVSLVAGGTFFAGDEHTHPDTPFYRSFLGAAVSVWLLQRLAFSFEQKIVTVYPTRGDEFQRRFMEPVVPGIGDTEDEDCDVDLEIMFTVFPGFRVSESIVESSVYILEKPKAQAVLGDQTSSRIEEVVDPSPSSAEVADPSPSSAEVADPSPSSAEGKPIQVEQLAKLHSLPAKRSESAAIKGSQKSSYLDGPTTKDGDRSTFLQRVVSKFTRKKGHAKDKAGDEASTVDTGEGTPAIPPALPSSLEGPPSGDSKQDMNSAVPAERDAPPESLNPEPVNAPDNAPDGDRPVYVTRAQKAAQLQSPLRSPRLSSVD